MFLVRGFVQGFNSAPLSVIGLVEIEPNHVHKQFPRTVIGGFPEAAHGGGPLPSLAKRSAGIALIAGRARGGILRRFDGHIRGSPWFWRRGNGLLLLGRQIGPWRRLARQFVPSSPPPAFPVGLSL